MKSLILNVKNLFFSYRAEKEILVDINFNLLEGEFLGILGPNGGGKSTLLNLISGQLKPSSGVITVLEDQQKSNIGEFLSYVPQSTKLNNIIPLTVFEVISFGKMIKKENSLLVKKVLAQVGLDNFENEIFSELSGGQKQKVLLAQALIKRPKLLLLDEPTNGLDSKGIDDLLNLIQNILKNKTSVIMVDHNINQILKHCDKIICINKGQHWHNRKDLITKDILESIYHCELEHLNIHEQIAQHNITSTHDHHECQHHDDPTTKKD